MGINNVNGFMQTNGIGANNVQKGNGNLKGVRQQMLNSIFTKAEKTGIPQDKQVDFVLNESKKFDTNHDGKISDEEAKAALKQLNAENTNASKKATAHASASGAKIDQVDPKTGEEFHKRIAGDITNSAAGHAKAASDVNIE